MQRKNNILKSSRDAIAMIMAIAVILIISTIMALSLAMTTTTGKRTTDIYLYEQAVLLSKSATEYALLRIAQNQPCTYSTILSATEIDYDDLNFVQDGIYDINISISYIYDSNASCIANGGTFYTQVDTEEQNGSAIIDVRVGVSDPSVSTEPITFFRRSIQKL